MIELIQRDGGDGAGFLQEKLDLPLGGQGMHHVAHGAHQIHRIEHDGGLGAVGQADGDPVIGADADGLQRTGAKLDLLDKIPVGGAAAHKIIGHIVGIFLRDALHRLKHGALEILQMGGDVAQALEPGHSDACCFTHLHYTFFLSFLSSSSTGCAAGSSSSSGCSRRCFSRRMDLE